MNIHVREARSPTARCSLLFRDYLRVDTVSRDVWGQFKVRLAETATDIYFSTGKSSPRRSRF